MRYRISHCLVPLLALFAVAACGVQQPPAPAAKPQLATYPAPDNGVSSPIMLETVHSRRITAPQTDGFLAGRTVKIGLLLPLTGRSAELGRAMQDAATVSLFDKYGRLSTRQATTKVELLPIDTGDTPEQAVAAMQQALDEGAEFIIGPLFGDATDAAAPLARARGISVLSLSNNVSQPGKGVYMYGFSPQEQTARVIHYALSTGKSRIAAMVPDAPLGKAVLTTARQTLADRGFALVKEVSYPAQGINIDTAADQLVSPGSAPDFDALLLPEGGAPLGTILRALQARGVSSRNVQLLGTGIWDDVALIRRVPLEGAWLASSAPNDTAAFEQRFRSTYHYLPPRIASLAYDAVALAVTLATSGRPFDDKTLTSPAGFVGPANGIFRLRANGKTERGLAVLQVQAGTFRMISPPPNGFAP